MSKRQTLCIFKIIKTYLRNLCPKIHFLSFFKYHQMRFFFFNMSESDTVKH